jgi:hypothetical protein
MIGNLFNFQIKFIVECAVLIVVFICKLKADWNGHEEESEISIVMFVQFKMGVKAQKAKSIRLLFISIEMKSRCRWDEGGKGREAPR